MFYKAIRRGKYRLSFTTNYGHVYLVPTIDINVGHKCYCVAARIYFLCWHISIARNK